MYGFKGIRWTLHASFLVSVCTSSIERVTISRRPVTVRQTLHLALVSNYTSKFSLPFQRRSAKGKLGQSCVPHLAFYNHMTPGSGNFPYFHVCVLVDTGPEQKLTFRYILIRFPCLTFKSTWKVYGIFFSTFVSPSVFLSLQ